MDFFVYNKKNVGKEEKEMKDSIWEIRKKLEENIKCNGLNSKETMKWSVLINKLININEKLKKYELRI